MTVAVLIVSYRSSKDLSRCLAALERSTHGDFRVVIVENGGTETFLDLKKTVPQELAGRQSVESHLAPHNLGFAGGVNYALDLAGPAEAYWILNPDTEADPHALAALIERVKQGDCDAAGHDVQQPDGKIASRGGAWRYLDARAASIGHGEPLTPGPSPSEVERSMNYLIGASMLVTPAFLQRVGRMREDYFLYCEEVEWCLRACAAGEHLGYAPGAVVMHIRGAATGGGGAIKERSKISVYLDHRNRLLLTRDLFPRTFPLTAAITLVKLCARHLAAGAWKQLGYALQGWLAGLNDERGAPPWFNTNDTIPIGAPSRAKTDDQVLHQDENA